MSSHGDAVLEVGAAEQVGEVLGLGALGVEGADDDPAVARGLAGMRVEERLARLERDRAGQRQPVGEPLGGDQQPRAEAAGGAQRDHVGGRAVGARELGREVEDAAHLGAAEAVDRLVRVADDGEVAAVAGERAEQARPGRGRCPGTRRRRRGGAGPQLVAVASASIVARRIRSA